VVAFRKETMVSLGGGTTMWRYLVAMTALAFATVIGMGVALAGGSSDTSGDGFHCYLFFSREDGKFAQAMANDSKPEEVLKKANEFIEKYELKEAYTLELSVGNIPGTVCGPIVVGD
jgi:hypothetical protein